MRRTVTLLAAVLTLLLPSMAHAQSIEPASSLGLPVRDACALVPDIESLTGHAVVPLFPGEPVAVGETVGDHAVCSWVFHEDPWASVELSIETADQYVEGVHYLKSYGPVQRLADRWIWLEHEGEYGLAEYGDLLVGTDTMTVLVRVSMVDAFPEIDQRALAVAIAQEVVGPIPSPSAWPSMAPAQSAGPAPSGRQPVQDACALVQDIESLTGHAIVPIIPGVPGAMPRTGEDYTACMWVFDDDPWASVMLSVETADQYEEHATDLERHASSVEHLADRWIWTDDVDPSFEGGLSALLLVGTDAMAVQVFVSMADAFPDIDQRALALAIAQEVVGPIPSPSPAPSPGASPGS
jgi:hypothetical protein